MTNEEILSRVGTTQKLLLTARKRQIKFSRTHYVERMLRDFDTHMVYKG